jgi:hypothetical protein
VRLYRGTEGPVCAHNDDGAHAGDKDLWRVGAAQVQAAAGGGAIGWESWERGRKVVRGCAHNDGVVRGDVAIRTGASIAAASEVVIVLAGGWHDGERIHVRSRSRAQCIK